MNQFETLIAICDRAIREGRAREAGNRLSHIRPASVPREWRLPLAKICRRAGQYSMGLRLLGRLVNRSESLRHREQATPGEIVEYAALLLRSGAVNEALKKLERVDPQTAPEALLIRSFVYFAQWEFAAAVPNLENYLTRELSPDSILVGQSNLAFAHSECGHYEQASLLAEKNIRLAKERGHVHLENYNNALLAQIHIDEGQFSLARKTVELALRESEGQNNSTHFFALKLKLILDGLETRTLSPFAELRRLAEMNRQWNALREADLYSLKVQFDQARFNHLYFGSPLAGVRERIWRDLGQRPEAESFILGAHAGPCFDLETGEIDGKDGLRASFKCHQLIAILLRDFYQPNQIAGLHAALYPDEHFDVSSSPDRVHQILRRTRRWLEAKRLPVEIGADQEFYSLKLLGNFSFRIPREHVPVNLHQWQMNRITTALAKIPLFSAAQIQRELGISTTSTHRFLKKAIERGELKRIGPMKRPLGYQFASQIQAKSAA